MNKSINYGILEINDISLFAHHGCFEQERIIGNKFLVQFSGKYDITKASESDNLDDAVNYQLVYNVIKEEMDIPSKLLEHVAGRILNRIQKEFPAIVSATISISKLNPPIGGQVGAFTLKAGFGDER